MEGCVPLMPDYEFYLTVYLGGSITEEEFPRFAKRAGEQLSRYKRIYTVTAPDEDSESMAICAMADAMFYFEQAQNGGIITSSSVGSVSSSSSASAVDISPKAQAGELYRCAKQYLDIYRGCR